MTTVAQDLLLSDPRTVIYPLGVDEYHQMITRGILREGEPFELLNGKIVAKDRSKKGEDLMTVGVAHTVVVSRLAALSPKLQALGCYMRTQQPVTLPPDNEPEPDGAIVIGAIEDYEDHQPAAGDVLCIIEVSDASLSRDRTVKRDIYATAGIAMYVILNLQDRAAEIYTKPVKGKARFAKRNKLEIDQTLSLPTASGKDVLVPLKKLLP